jgi:PD-(D/E)XK nuclease superfamily
MPQPSTAESAEIEALTKVVVDCGYRLHHDLGPGLLESFYELLLCEYHKEKA